MPSPPVGIEAEVVTIVRRIGRQPVEPRAESDLALDLGFDSMRVFELIGEAKRSAGNERRHSVPGYL